MYLLRKAHVRAYDRVSKTGALQHIREHEDGRVRRYGLKLAGSKDSHDLHQIRRDRFGHLPHWNSLDEHTRHAVLDAEDEKARQHKEFEEWKDKAHGKPKPDAVKVDRSNWQQQLMLKGHPMYLLKSILRKSQMSFDFGKHEEERTVHATTRHMQSGVVVQVKEHQRKTVVADKPNDDHNFYINKYKDIAAKHGASTAKDRARTFSASSFLSREFGETQEQFFARNPKLGKLAAWISDGFPDMPDKPKQPQQVLEPKGAATLMARQITAKDNFDKALMTIAGITREQAQRVTQYYLDKKLAVMDSVNGTIRSKHGAYLDKDVVLNAVKLSGQPDTKKVGATKDPLKIRQQDDDRKRDQAEAHTERVKRLLERYHSEPDREYAEDMYGESLRKYGAHPEQKPQYTPEATEQKPYLPIFEKPVRKPRGNSNKPAAPEHRIAKVDDPDGGHGHFVIYDKDMKTIEIPNEHGEIEAVWPRLLDASRALNRHTGSTHTQQKVARGEYDMHKSIAHPVSLIKSRKLHGRINFQGLDISIETGRSRIRSWYNPHDGSQGMSRMTLPYGYIKGTLGTDGDHVDVFVGPDHSAGNVYVVHTMKAPDFTEYDEDKCFVGLNSPEEAERAFNASYSDPRFFGGMSIWPLDEFKQDVLSGEAKGQPLVKSMNDKSGLGRFLSESELREYALLGVLKVNPKDICMDEFRQGMKAEQEHQDITGGDRVMTAKIVLAHLKEDPRYYTKLKRAGLE